MVDNTKLVISANMLFIELKVWRFEARFKLIGVVNKSLGGGGGCDRCQSNFFFLIKEGELRTIYLPTHPFERVIHAPHFRVRLKVERSIHINQTLIFLVIKFHA